MRWNDHSRDNLEEHALLSPSGYSWVNYTPEEMAEKLTRKYYAFMRAPAGTAIHDFAASCIELKEKLPKQVNNVAKMIKIYMFDAYKNKGMYSMELINFISSLPEHVFRTLILYVNDCIGFGMDPEQKLVYSYSCHGKADAASFENNILRISDLKTGDGVAHMEQLFVYDALFCLEYNFKPNQIKIENRLYQYGEIQEVIDVPPEIILNYMQVIMMESKFAQQLRGKE